MTDAVDPRRARFVRRTLPAAALAAAFPGAFAAPPGSASSSSNEATNEPTDRAPMTPNAPLMATRPIPATGEPLPVVGCGTWIGFDVADDPAATARLGGVVDALFAAGGRVLDSSPMYGRSEAVTGRLLATAHPAHGEPFVATKVWTRGRDAGIAQMEASVERLGRVDLMQVHNLVDWQTHLPTMRRWKADGQLRYVGVSHYTSGAYRELEAVMKGEPLDFVQVDYAFDDRDAEDRILPLAKDRGIAVLVNRPFGGGDLLKRLVARPLPSWAADLGAASWSQVLLKFVLSHPAVTCVIPGTGNPRHMADNAAAGVGAPPDRAFWRRIGTSLDG